MHLGKQALEEEKGSTMTQSNGQPNLGSAFKEKQSPAIVAVWDVVGFVRLPL